MGKGNLISGSFWFIISVFVTIESYRLGLGSLTQPGPGFLFFWAAVFLGLLSLSIMVEAWRGRGSQGESQTIFGNVNLRKILFVLIATFLYALLLEKLGFIIMTLVLLVFLLGFIEKKGWPYTILVSLAITSAAYLVFEVWLKTQLPLGILEPFFY